MVMLMMRTRGKLTGKLGTYIARYLVVVVTTNPRILSTTRKETIVQIKKITVIILLSANLVMYSWGIKVSMIIINHIKFA